MAITKLIAKHIREIHFGGNWTDVNLKDSIADISWEQAITNVYSLNNIATLVSHMNYYVSAVLKVLEGGPLNSSDKFSFDLPPVQCQADWENLRQKALDEAEQFAVRIENLPDSVLEQDFTDEKYGNYYRNLHGIIEHCHYHLGQIILLKRIVTEFE